MQKWLRAGVSEDGQWSETTVGTPQGAVASHCAPTRTCTVVSAELARWRDAFFQIGLRRQDENRCKEIQKLKHIL
jgi:hypothetical protein